MSDPSGEPLAGDGPSEDEQPGPEAGAQTEITSFFKRKSEGKRRAYAVKPSSVPPPSLPRQALSTSQQQATTPESALQKPPLPIFLGADGLADPCARFCCRTCWRTPGVTLEGDSLKLVESGVTVGFGTRRKTPQRYVI